MYQVSPGSHIVIKPKMDYGLLQGLVKITGTQEMYLETKPDDSNPIISL